MKTYIAAPASRAIALSKKAAFVAIGAAAFSLLSLNASATELAPPQRAVHYGDLDLSKQKDTERLYRRLRYASEQVCGITDRASARASIHRRECAATALNNAVMDVGHPSLRALHAAKSDVKLAERMKQDSTKS